MENEKTKISKKRVTFKYRQKRNTYDYLLLSDKSSNNGRVLDLRSKDSPKFFFSLARLLSSWTLSLQQFASWWNSQVNGNGGVARRGPVQERMYFEKGGISRRV